MTPHSAAHSERLDGPGRPRFWRSMAEWSEGTSRDATDDEFPDRALPDEPTRREFMKLASASLALAGVAGCNLKQPPEKIVPYVEMPEHLVPGRPLYFATACERSGLGLGLVAESHEGRPTKIEGNPDHPSSVGATDVFAQAEVLSLYDPDRSRTVLHRERPGELSTLEEFREALSGYVEEARKRRGAGFRILTPYITSPTLVRLLRILLDDLPEARWHVWEATASFNDELGVQRAFGTRLKPLYHFDRPDAILAIDADILAVREFPPRYARDVMMRRRLATQKPGAYTMSRLYSIDCTPTLTGAKADHRWLTTPAKILPAVQLIAKELDVDVGEVASAGLDERWLRSVAKDLRRVAREGEGAVVVAGPYQPPAVHEVVQRINERLGAIGKAVEFIESPIAQPQENTGDFRELVEEMRAGKVETLVILDADPVGQALPDLDVRKAIASVPRSIHLGLHENATSRACRWHVPKSHFLESWGDIRGHDGTIAITQPLVEPLYRTLSPLEVVALLAGRMGSAYDLVRETYADRFGDDFEQKWHEFLRVGVLPDTKSEAVDVAGRRLSGSERPVFRGAKGDAQEPNQNASHFTLVFRPDPTLWDGRYANNGWLQELPKPLTKLTWSNAALVSPSDAAALGLEDGEIVEIRRGDAAVSLPVFRLPLQPAGCITLHFGHGAADLGRVAATAGGVAVNVLRTWDRPWTIDDATLKSTGQKIELPTTQSHFSMEGDHLVRGGTLQELNATPDRPAFAHPHEHRSDASLYNDWKYDGQKWGMSIDLTTCTGCGACVIACQAENNIPVVGLREVLRKREMHWIRIDTYFEGAPDAPGRVLQQPVPCMHCELAPCEPVCPVAATVHSGTGLNQMVYNRCIGTRYCSNNCPYKVRRFNFLAYSDRFHTDPILQMLPNPNVTVRSRGVMEKCTYCVQRIEAATIDAKVAKRPLGPNEIETACQQVCPTEAIVFGDLNNTQSSVAALKNSPLDYALLEELNTRPRTTYLAEVHNENNELKGSRELA